MNSPVDSVMGRGEIIVAITKDYTYVCLQFLDPDWWIHFTAAEARSLAGLLAQKADDIDAARALRDHAADPPAEREG